MLQAKRSSHCEGLESLVAFLIQGNRRHTNTLFWWFSGHTCSSDAPLSAVFHLTPLILHSLMYSPHLLLEYEHCIFLGTDGSLPQSVHHVQIIAICQGKQVEGIWSHPRARGVSKQFARMTVFAFPRPFGKKNKSFAYHWFLRTSLKCLTAEELLWIHL